MSTAPSWIDDFLFWDALIVALLIFSDWILGRDRRERMKESVGDWWLYLDSSTYAGLVAEDAGRVRRFLERLFSHSWLSPTFLQRTFLYSTPITFLVLMVGQIALLFVASSVGSAQPSETNQSPEPLSQIFYGILIFAVLPVIAAIPPMITPNVITAWLSIGFTLFLLKKMEQSTSFGVLLSILICDLAAVYLVTLLSFALLSYSLMGFSFGLYASLPGLFWFLGVAAMAVTNALSTLVHAGLSLLFILSKLVSPALKRPTEVLLIRFYESDKGVLTQLAIGLGGFAKIVHEIVKYANS